MSKTIWKFALALVDVQEIQIPKRARVLCVQLQHGAPCLWAHVDPDNMTEVRRFRIVGTGHPAPEDVSGYIGTFQIHGGALIFHVFEGAA